MQNSKYKYWPLFRYYFHVLSKTRFPEQLAFMLIQPWCVPIGRVLSSISLCYSSETITFIYEIIFLKAKGRGKPSHSQEHPSKPTHRRREWINFVFFKLVGRTQQCWGVVYNLQRLRGWKSLSSSAEWIKAGTFQLYGEVSLVVNSCSTPNKKQNNNVPEPQKKDIHNGGESKTMLMH